MLICTFEKAEALVRFLGPLFVRRVTLVVIDEAHNVNFSGIRADISSVGNRTLRLEAFGMRLFAALDSTRAQTIALSAVAQNIQGPLAAWVSRSEGEEPIKTEYRSTRQLIGRLECSNSRFTIEYDLLDGSNLAIARGAGEERLYIPDPVPPCIIPAGFEGSEKAVRPYVFWAAMHFAAPDSDGRRRAVLISVAEKPGGFAQDLLTLLEGAWADVNVPAFFATPENDGAQNLWERCVASCADYFGTDSREYRLLIKGIVVHHGKMPGLMARLLVQVIDAGIVHLVIATSTLTEGVNLPFDTILVPSLKRWNGDITPEEFANLAGRAGRPMRAIEGRTLVVLRDNPYDWHSVQARKRYNGLIRDLGQSVQTERAAPKSALAELIEHLEGTWRQIHNGGPDDFIQWLETASIPPPEDPQNIKGNSVQTDADHEADALDALDGVLLPAIVEIENLRESALTLDDLEEGLTRIWRSSYARYANVEQARLGQLFNARGRGIATKIYPDAAERKRVYSTSLPPREARTLLNAYPQIYAVLKAGSDYALWNADRRLAYIQSLVEALSLVPTFAVPTPKRMGTDNPWDLLRWWLLGSNSVKRPSVTQVTNWHAYAANNFTYRFCWGIGGILATAANEAHHGVLKETSLDDWNSLDLPWAALWLKELMIWGTHEPVATYLLAKNLEPTRSDAELSALEYYQLQGPQVETNDLLDPRRIRSWCDDKYGTARKSTSRDAATFKAVLSRDFTGHESELWKVLPGAYDGTVYWFDPAGHLFATTSGVEAEDWHEDLRRSHDFTLDPRRKIINGRPYLRG